jgi:acetyl/propionyl-CoA carboxylase alpha subunit
MKGNNNTVRRVLIANRGEIARRIIRTCHRMGIETVAVYSDVDAHAPHVSEATFKEAIGAPTAYLSIDSIIQAVKHSGADSVHPGYGFLSENPAFVEALEREAITCIGPTSTTIRKLGSKTSAKELAKEADVPVAPTLLLRDEDLDTAAAKLDEFASRVGYPVIIKAAAGGGGRGMRVVNQAGDCRQELESAGREALKAFGSDEIFVEKFVAPARHIEVQIAGDAHGNCVALGTRDCSLQRSNQKIIEEAPATGLQPGVVEALCEAACRLAKASKYCNLGTVEFLYTSNGAFYFLEVNTRLQVEHPVTEMVTGLDLVEVQIRLARGESLESILGTLRSPSPAGHAIEARWCAEEYAGRFISATGIILDRVIATDSSLPGTVRADMGYEICSEVTHFYDSLLGKLIVHAPDRESAINLMSDVLERSWISGVGTNRSLLLHLISTEEFRHLQHSVQGTSTLLPTLDDSFRVQLHAHAICAALRMHTPLSQWAGNSPWFSHAATGATIANSYPLTTESQGQRISSTSSYSKSPTESAVLVEILTPKPRMLTLTLSSVVSTSQSVQRCSVTIDSGSAFEVEALHDGETTWIHTPWFSIAVKRALPARTAGDAEAHSSGASLTSPIPGKVAALYVKKGDVVQEGDLLLVLDSMKMEHPFRANRSGTITSLEVKQGAVIQAGSLLLEIL